MLPIEGFRYQRYRRGSSTAEQYRGDRNTRGVFPGGGDRWALGRRDCESGVRMGGWLLSFWSPRLPLPIDQTSRRFFSKALPPDISIVRVSDVGKYAVTGKRRQSVGIGFLTGTRSNSEKSGLGVYGVQLAVRSKFHPGNVVTDRLNLPPRQRRNHHRHVGFTAR